MATQPRPAPRTATATATAAQPAQTEADFLTKANKADNETLTRTDKNPIYQMIFAGELTREQRITQAEQYLLAGLADGSATPEQMDERRTYLMELNAAIQVLRRQLGIEQARQITDQSQADFQRILTMTSEDVAKFEEMLSPHVELATLFSKYGTTGNLIEKINAAKAQKQVRDRSIALWNEQHAREVRALQAVVQELNSEIASDKDRLERAWLGKAAIEARIANNQAALTERQEQLTAALAKTMPEMAGDNDGTEIINPEILELQNIGGPKFRTSIVNLRDMTEQALAKISVNFDEAVRGLENSRAAFITMDRNIGEARMALSILDVAVSRAEKAAREIASKQIVIDADGSDPAMANLQRMEAEQRNEQILAYTTGLTTFQRNITEALASLGSNQTVIKDVLRMNLMAIEAANTHKLTGMANAADAVTITIGSIIEVCNRAAGQALADGQTRIRQLAEAGSARLVGGVVESLEQQNQQLADVAASLTHLREMTTAITANSVGMIKKQFELVGAIRTETNKLADATTAAEQATFQARAGVVENAPTEETEQPVRRFGMRVGGHG